MRNEGYLVEIRRNRGEVSSSGCLEKASEQATEEKCDDAAFSISPEWRDWPDILSCCLLKGCVFIYRMGVYMGYVYIWK